MAMGPVGHAQKRWAFTVERVTERAGDGNRTRTTSLGSFVIRPLNLPDQLVRLPVRHRH